MGSYKLYYATNRNHIGDRWKPNSYGNKFSDDGAENLRFGVVKVSLSDREVEKYLKANVKGCGVGDGEGLSDYITKCMEKPKRANIQAYEEHVDETKGIYKFGSKEMFADVKADMDALSDVLIYIHGYNMNWNEAVAAALALQIGLRSKGDQNQNICVFLFTWPSDGRTIPWSSYKSDRSEAKSSGAAFGRALLKTRDFLVGLKDRAKSGGEKLCGQDIHLLCHSMGNYLLQETLARLADFTPGNALPRIFEHVFLCAPDVDDTALEPGKPLGYINEIARNITLYHNKGDAAMVISDYTKGQPERLGGAGAAHPALLHNKIHQVDCTPIVRGWVEHSYYLVGKILTDIRLSIDGVPFDEEVRARSQDKNLKNVWVMK